MVGSSTRVFNSGPEKQLQRILQSGGVGGWKGGPCTGVGVGKAGNLVHLLAMFCCSQIKGAQLEEFAATTCSDFEQCGKTRNEVRQVQLDKKGHV